MSLCAIGAFLGSWLGKHFKEQQTIAATRRDLDDHLKWAKEKEEAFVHRMGAMQDQSIRNGEQIGNLVNQVTRIAATQAEIAASVNTLKGVVSTVFASGHNMMTSGPA